MRAQMPVTMDELVNEVARLRQELDATRSRLAELEACQPAPPPAPCDLLTAVFPVAELLSAVSVAVVIIDGQRTMRALNSYAVTMLGYTADELCGRPVEMLFAPTVIERCGAMIQSFLDSPHSASSLDETSGAVKLRRQDGSVLAADALIVRSGVPQYTRLYSALVIIDVTQQFRAREALEQSEARLQLTLQAARAGVWQRDLVTGQATWSDGAFQVLGYAPGSVEPSYENWISRVHPDDRVKAHTALAETLTTTSTVATEYRVVWPDGSVRWLRDVGRVEYDETGRPRTMSGVQFDITEMALYRAQLEDLLAQGTAELSRITQLHSAIVNDTDLIIISTDPQGVIQTFNRSAERMLGYSPDEVIGQVTPQFLHHPAELAKVGINPPVVAADGATGAMNEVIARLNAEISGPREWTFVRKDGSTFPVLLTVSPLYDPSGALLGHVGLAADIADLKQADRQLRYYASLQEAVNDAVIGADLDFCIQSWNAAAERIYGWRADEVMGKRVNDLLRTEFPAHLTRAQVIDQFQRDGYWSGEVTQQRKDGSRLHMLSSVALVRDQGGTPIGLVAVNYDITQLKQAQQAMRESQERLQILFDHGPDALVLCRADGVVTDINRACEELSGWSRAEAQGVHFADLRLMDDEAMWQATVLMREYRQGESNPAFDFTLYRRDRSALEVEARVYPVTLFGQAHFLAAIRDITVRKQGEEQLRAALQQQAELNTLKSRFISMVSHEFRTPLATILATVETLSAYRERMDEQQIERRFDKVREQVEYMKDMLADVLMVAAMQAEKIDVSPVETDLDAFCRELLDEMKPDDSRRIHYTCVPQPLVTAVDRKLMRQIVGNLLSNALKYSPDDRPVAFEVAGTDGRVTLRVRDEGIGIPEADQKHLFEAFHRGANVGAVSGSGLGLSIVKQSVDALGGAVEARSQPGQGTTMTVSLPMARPRQRRRARGSGT